MNFRISPIGTRHVRASVPGPSRHLRCRPILTCSEGRLCTSSEFLTWSGPVPRRPTAGMTRVQGLSKERSADRDQKSTRRPSASVHSGRRGIPDRRRAALSSRELAGRGAGRGGSRSEVAMGSTRSGSSPAAARVARAKPNQVVSPLVGHVEHPRTPVEGQADHGPGQVGGEGGAAVLVVDEPEGAVGIGSGQPENGLDHVGAVGAAHPGRPHDGGGGTGHGRPPRSPHRACSVRTPSGARGCPIRHRAGPACRRRHSRWRCRPGGRPRRPPPRPRCGYRGR